MGDLKTNWTNPVMSAPDLSGDTVTSRGSDPNADGGDGKAALDPIWNNAFVPTPSGEESSNSVSGLPATPNRWQPKETPPEPPNLTDRRPGNVDKQ